MAFLARGMGTMVTSTNTSERTARPVYASTAQTVAVTQFDVGRAGCDTTAMRRLRDGEASEPPADTETHNLPPPDAGQEKPGDE